MRVGYVLRVLGRRIDQAVADREALQVDLLLSTAELLVVGDDPRRDGRDVVAGVRLARDEEVELRVLREFLHEGLEELPHVRGDAVLGLHVGLGVVGVREARADRLVDEQHVRDLGPRVRIGADAAVFSESVRALLVENGEL